MRKIKLTFGLIVIIFIALVIYQNRAYFFAKQALSLSLGVETWHWMAPEIQNVAYFGGSLLIGFIFAGYFGLVSKYRSSKAIKQLNQTLINQSETIVSLQTQIENMKNDPYSAPSSSYSSDALQTAEVAATESTVESAVQEDSGHTVKLDKA